MSIFWKQKKVLVVGASGLIGRHITEQLLIKGAQVTITSRREKRLNGLKTISLDPTEYRGFSALQDSYDVLINCAALDGNSHFKDEHATEICDQNIRITLNVLRFAQEHHIVDVVLFSSSDVYVDLKKNSVSETDVSKVSLFQTNGYRAAKLISEMLVNFYSQAHQLRIYVPRPSYVYGKGDMYKGDSNSRLVPLLVKKIAHEEHITFYGSSDKKLNLIHAIDLSDAVLRLVELQKTGVTNISSPEVVSISRLIQVIAQKLGKAPKVTYKSASYKPSVLMNTRRLQSIKKSFLSLEQGVEQMLNAFGDE